MNPVFLILHGSFATPDSNWFMMLKERLERISQTALLPAFPVDEWNQLSEGMVKTKENLESWVAIAKTILEEHSDKPLIVVGHSLAPLFALHLVEKLNLQIDCLIAVCPFLELDDDKTPWQIQVVNRTFYKTDFDASKMRQHIKTSYVLYSDNDPYVPAEKSLQFAKLLDASRIQVRGAAHMNAAVNMHDFPLVLELCKSRLNLSLYQKYIDHRAELFQEDTAKYHTEKLVEFSPEDIFDEGIFKFRNLQTSGFCTFPTNTHLWDAESLYMQESRKAAQRLGNFKRVYLIEKSSDLERPELQEQISADIDGGIQVFGVKGSDLPAAIAQKDFGIWDDEYVCFIESMQNTKPKVMLSSRSSDLKQAQTWRTTILGRAHRVQSLAEMKPMATR